MYEKIMAMQDEIRKYFEDHPEVRCVELYGNNESGDRFRCDWQPDTAQMRQVMSAEGYVRVFDLLRGEDLGRIAAAWCGVEGEEVNNDD